ncbi:MAG: organomercurial lyase [Paracoccaceae bacterium]
MSVVSSSAVRNALPRLLTELRIHERWADIDETTLSLHRSILTAYVRTGTAPDASELDHAQLLDLNRRDLIVLDGASISAAYPFSTIPTRHSVRIGEREIACVCAIDALGTGAMVRQEVRVNSRCPQCDQCIVVDIAENGLRIVTCEPVAARIWAGIVPIKGCAATSQCQSMLAFCCQEHLDEWRSGDENRREGYAFSVEQAVQAGAAIFRPFLP